jgi:hypothetical protein
MVLYFCILNCGECQCCYDSEVVSVPPDPAMAMVTLQKVDGGSENDAAPDVADIDVVDETGDAPISW